MAKATTPATATETAAAPEGAGLDPAANTEPVAPETLPGDTGNTEPEAPTEPAPPIAKLSAYEQAEAFIPDPWDQLPEDPEVRRLYLAIHGDVNFFVR
jgi:hypothetical protein